jgi:undecaprenyl-diphosphatase
MYWASNRFIWIPFYALLLFFVVKIFGRKTYIILVLVAAMITVSDQVSSSLVKNAVLRLRPCHDPAIQEKVHLVNGICGGKYGYFSSHASNSWSLAIFLILIFRKSMPVKGVSSDGIIRLTTIFLLTYAIVVSYSRIYLGIHYPFDVFSGMAFGSMIGFIFANIFYRFNKIKTNLE